MKLVAEGFSFSDQARQALAIAKEEADGLRHEYLGAEHILLGLMRMSAGAASAAFNSVEVNRSTVRTCLEELLPPGNASSGSGEIPYHESGLDVLEKSMLAARDGGGRAVTTGHLLLGTLMVQGGIPLQALQAAEVNVSDLSAALQERPEESP